MRKRVERLMKLTGKASTDAERRMLGTGMASTDAERQDAARKTREWNMMDTTGRAMTEAETERLLKKTYR